jgi:hypothetical protein
VLARVTEAVDYSWQELKEARGKVGRRAEHARICAPRESAGTGCDMAGGLTAPPALGKVEMSCRAWVDLTELLDATLDRRPGFYRYGLHRLHHPAFI